MTRRIHVIGIGAGDPDYVTAEAVRALNDTQVFFAMDKGEAKSDLVALRRQICERFIREPGYRFVELADPPRAKDAEYRQAVADWHSARAGSVGRRHRTGTGTRRRRRLPRMGRPVAVRQHAADPRHGGCSASRSHYDVIPGITAIQALTARHRIPLNDIGEPVLITTGRRLAADGLTGSAVVMLDGDCAFRSCPPETRIWWGAYLGTPDEMLVSGTVGEVGEQIAELRAEARARHGWIMDTYLLRSR